MLFFNKFNSSISSGLREERLALVHIKWGGGGLSIVYTINVQALTRNFAKKSKTKGLNQSQKTSEVQVCNIYPLPEDIKTDATIVK